MYKFASTLTSSLHLFGIVEEVVHLRSKLLVRLEIEAATCSLQSLCLLELLVVWSKEHWHVPYASFEYVVNANTETSTHVSDVTIMIDARQQAKTVDNQYIGGFES